ncbi:beta-galactoside-binding lectin-like [Pholidichthys leucotaenia]
MSFSAGQTMTISGVVNIDPTMFTVNIGDLNAPSGQGNIALHVDLRFDVKGQKNVLVLNSRDEGKWEKEVLLESFPFQGGKPFKIVIAFSSAEFGITCNDQEKIHFRNRVGQQSYKNIDFEGDVSISSVIIS